MIISNTKPVYALVRCTEIIVVCKVRGVQSNGEDCCKNMFDRKPIFTAKGVCYTSQNLQDARYPSDLDAVHIWLAPTKVDIEYSSTVVLIYTIFKRQIFGGSSTFWLQIFLGTTQALDFLKEFFTLCFMQTTFFSPRLIGNWYLSKWMVFRFI